MTDLKDLLDDLAGTADPPTADVVRADLARGRRTLRRARGARLAAAAAAVVAVTGIGTGIFAGGGPRAGEVGAVAPTASGPYTSPPDLSGAWEIVLTFHPERNREWNHLRLTRRPDDSCAAPPPCYRTQLYGPGVWQDATTQVSATLRGAWIDVRVTGESIYYWGNWTLRGRAENEASTPLVFRGTWKTDAAPRRSGTFTMRRQPGCTDRGCPPPPDNWWVTPSPSEATGRRTPTPGASATSSPSTPAPSRVRPTGPTPPGTLRPTVCLLPETPFPGATPELGPVICVDDKPVPSTWVSPSGYDVRWNERGRATTAP